MCWITKQVVVSGCWQWHKMNGRINSNDNPLMTLITFIDRNLKPKFVSSEVQPLIYSASLPAAEISKEVFILFSIHLIRLVRRQCEWHTCNYTKCGVERCLVEHRSKSNGFVSADWEWKWTHCMSEHWACSSLVRQAQWNWKQLQWLCLAAITL